MNIMSNGVKEKIQSDITEAIKIGSSQKLSVLRMVSAAIHNKEIEKRTRLSRLLTPERSDGGQVKVGPSVCEAGLPTGEAGSLSPTELKEQSRLNEEEILEVLASEVKKRKEAVLEYEKGNRHDLADKEKAEIEILKLYLPQELSEEELRKIIQETIRETGAQTAKDFGKVMSVLMSKVKGRADGVKVSQIVRELLSL